MERFVGKYVPGTLPGSDIHIVIHLVIGD